ncbi:MAG: response regulator [Candidatus Bruticola sp.]
MANEVILVVDDEEFNRDMLSRRLRREGYETFTAPGGREAIALVDTLGRIDIVLLDIMMPEMDGFQTLEKLRTKYSDNSLPVIMLTAIGDSESIVKALNMGASDYVTKPVNIDVLKARIQSRLAKRQPSQEDCVYVPSAGSKLGSYLLKSEIGRGATSTVFLAEDTRLTRQVAVKVLKPEFCADEEALGRFVREAKTVASIDHPGVVGIFEIAHKPCSYLAMEYLKGTNMSSFVGVEPLAVAEAVDYAWQIADILTAVHEKGIIHRDLKPQNLIVDDCGCVHLMDFGTAKLLNKESNLTKAGTILGTPRYMAPEQIDGRMGPVGEATDLFPLGLMLYEMISGKKAIEGDSFHSIFYELFFREPDSLIKVNSAVPLPLDDLCRRLQASKVDERPQTAAEVRDELARIKDML